MKISELKERKIVRRATRNFDLEGNRIYNEFEYDLPYQTIYKRSERERLFAKIIDMAPFFLVFFFIFHKIAILSILFSIICVIIVGAISESYFGTTLGKKIFKMKVINDEGNYPNFLKSLLRNFLCLANFNPEFSDCVFNTVAMGKRTATRVNFSMHLNNQICKTHIVKESTIAEIRNLLNHEQPKQNVRLLD